MLTAPCKDAAVSLGRMACVVEPSYNTFWLPFIYITHINGSAYVDVCSLN